MCCTWPDVDATRRKPHKQSRAGEVVAEAEQLPLDQRSGADMAVGFNQGDKRPSRISLSQAPYSHASLVQPPWFWYGHYRRPPGLFISGSCPSASLSYTGRRGYMPNRGPQVGFEASQQVTAQQSSVLNTPCRRAVTRSPSRRPQGTSPVLPDLCNCTFSSFVQRPTIGGL